MKKPLAIASVLIGLSVPVAAPAHAVDPAKGYNGICTGADALSGVTVVVDFNELDGNGGKPAPTITRCSPNPSGATRTGIKALQDAGIAVAGTTRWGLGFVCRLENRPSSTETIRRTSNPNYKEPCVNTPPAEAYWGYWHADGTGNTWTYSNFGALNRNVIPGGFEGWSFALNGTADSNPVPRIAPVRPGTENKPCNAVEQPKPNTGDLGEKAPPQQPPAARPPVEEPPEESNAELPPPKPRASAKPKPDPGSNAAFTGGESAENVTEAIERQSGASDYAPWAAGAAVLVLAVAGFFAARRRKRAQES